VLDAAHLSASSQNGQPWHFIVVQDRAKLRRLGELLQSGRYIAGAAFAVAVAVNGSSPYRLADAGRAIQSMVLTAWSDGIGSNWVGFEGTLDPAGPEFGLPPELRLVAIVPFGYPVEKLGRGKKRRRPFEDVVSSESYGKPFI
jgi:nitroreductase